MPSQKYSGKFAQATVGSDAISSESLPVRITAEHKSYLLSLNYVSSVATLSADEFISAYETISEMVEGAREELKTEELIVAGDFNSAGYRAETGESLLLAHGYHQNLEIQNRLGLKDL
ncbi:hypothetical protein QAD02_011650 [Eretmocerus hayati]|uniref:Uncharacterized protein n=1 Tax=Eretmocerus hayati TaxID=131215 RepID=A0ACC2NX55_9HYME|nr:hypothetical protein QAD02_011650 [Eretmocerus hayati]